MEDAIIEWFEELNGVASVPDVADFFEYDVNYVRDYARENDLPRVGANYVFRAEDALDLWSEATAEDEDGEETDDEETEDDDEAVSCSSCGETVLDAAYCSACGEALDDEEEDEDSEEEEEEAA